MRDPVERAWSAARMRQRNMKGDKKSTFDEFAYLEKKIKSGAVRHKSQYEKTIQELEKTFSQDKIYYGFYESMFQESSFHSIQTFLNFQLNSFDTSQVFNPSPKNKEITRELNQSLVKHFEPTYDFIASRFGDNIKKLWQGYELL